MKKICWFSRLSDQQPRRAAVRRAGGGMGAAVLLMTAGIAVAQVATPATPPPDTQPVAPAGYTLHESIDLGGHIVGLSGSGAMYDTLVNQQSGPRALGETFELRALPGTKNTIVDSLSAFSNGWGGDANNFARMDFYKGKLYDFSGLFRRDRQYFDYDLLGNPNIPSGQSIPVSGGSPYAWPQVNRSPFLFNTVRRMTDTSLTLLPLSKVSFRAGYSQDIFAGPSLTPSGYQVAGSYDILLQEMQRNSTDRFFGAIDWKPVPATRLTFEEQVDHYKADSYFTMDPSYFNVQEPNGAKVALLANYDSLTPYASSACNANSVGTTPVLSAPNTPGGLPVVNPACAVLTSYQRYQPTRILYPTEIFRFQSSSIKNVSMNGDVRYTNANMSLPSYYDSFQGLAKTTREQIYTATASAKREVTAIDYGIEWQASEKLGLSDAVTYSNTQEPGTTTMTSVTTVSTPATAGNETINTPTLTTTVVNTPINPATGKTTSTFEGSGNIAVPLPDFFGQKFVTNDATATWYGWSRATVSLTWRYRKQVIAEGIPHSTALAVTEPGNLPADFTNPTSNGTVTINQNGGILNVALRPTNQWAVDGSLEVLYADNVFTPVAPREQQHYRLHALYKPKSWATVSGAYNDMELHNNTNNTGIAPLDGPLDHVAHSRVVTAAASLMPKESYGVDFDYAYSDVYASTNICYLAGATATLPGAAPPNGAGCPATSPNRGGGYDFGPVKDFMDAPTQSGSVALYLAPSKKLRSNIGYRVSSVDGTRFYNDARDVAGSLVSTYQSPFVNAAWTVHPGFIWKAEYNYFGYGEGGASGAPYCSTANPSTSGGTVPVVPCNSSSLAGLQTGLTLPSSGETAPRNFHANNVTLGFHYEF